MPSRKLGYFFKDRWNDFAGEAGVKQTQTQNSSGNDPTGESPGETVRLQHTVCEGRPGGPSGAEETHPPAHAWCLDVMCKCSRRLASSMCRHRFCLQRNPEEPEERLLDYRGA